jgi:predicted DNA-binding transcriptional regulator YafY
MRLRLAGTIELERIVLAWGEHAVVVAPKALRDKVRKRLRQMVERYGEDDTV